QTLLAHLLQTDPFQNQNFNPNVISGLCIKAVIYFQSEVVFSSFWPCGCRCLFMLSQKWKEKQRDDTHSLTHTHPHTHTNTHTHTHTHTHTEAHTLSLTGNKSTLHQHPWRTGLSPIFD